MHLFNSRRRRRIGVGLMALSLVLAACGGDQATDSASPGAAVDGDSSAPVEAGGIDPNGSLVYVHTRAINVIDPDRETTGQTLAYFFPVYDRLIHLTPTGDLVPGLATEWTLIDDGNTWEFKLRDGVTFHDGTPFNAEAVAFNFDRSANLEGVNATSRNNVQPILNVTVVDDLTVHVTRRPEAEFDVGWSLFVTRLSENIGMMVSPAAADRENFGLLPVGAGPYKVVDFTDEKASYERYDGYWDPEVTALAKLEIYQPVNPEAVSAGLQSGLFDIAAVGPQQVDTVEGAGINVQVQESNTIFIMWVNHTRPPLDDSNIRQTLLYGIDRQELVDVVMGVGTPTHQPFPPAVTAHNPACGVDKWPYDPEKVKELVAASSYPDGPTIEIMTNNEPQRIAIAELVKEQMGRGGVDIDIVLTEPAQFERYFQGEYTMAHGRRGRTDPFEALVNTWAEDGDSNPGGFNTQSIQDNLAAIARAATPAERLSRIQDMSCEVVEDGMSPGLFGISLYWGINPRVVGFEPPVTPYPEFRGVGVSR